MNTHTICFRGEISKILIWIPVLSGTMGLDGDTIRLYKPGKRLISDLAWRILSAISCAVGSTSVWCSDIKYWANFCSCSLFICKSVSEKRHKITKLIQHPEKWFFFKHKMLLFFFICLWIYMSQAMGKGIFLAFVQYNQGLSCPQKI